MNVSLIQILLFLAVSVMLAIPLGHYIDKIMHAEPTWLSKRLRPVETACYRAIGVNEDVEMSGRSYFINVMMFSAFGLLAFWLTLVFSGINPGLSFNIASSFVSNTNWQSYAGETTLQGWQQALLLTTQNFVSAAVGISVLYALIRALRGTQLRGVGNFYVDLTRVVLYILLPLATLLAIILSSQGVVQSLYNSTSATTLSGTKQYLPLGPVASQEAIKQLGTNGGGFFGANSAMPFENPTFISNFLECLAIIIIPIALCFAFGRGVKNPKQGRAIFISMFVLLIAALIGTYMAEYNYHVAGIDPSAGNMEGKESRFGAGLSALWAIMTTAASNGSVNSMHDSYTPFGGFFPMLLMQLGEVVFGGVGSGLYGMLGFVILTVFITGLMIGRTPEYLNKKIDPIDMKMAVVLCLTTPLLILVGSGVAALWPESYTNVTNPGIHAFSELLYGYTSAGANNGSAFAGLDANTNFFNLTMGLSMLLARFVPIWATLKLAESMRTKSRVAESSATLRTDSPLFIGLLIFNVLLIGALSMFPALALGPIAEGLL
ncbi:potassium-transporting ATPase subunit A [Boudabousia liubingyangii]|uniref:Potassium-transporting ATPase potassium-binding subunit n=1 Tax=Boudabousia liubingyangii TaxID=1921764 RepID=A0A1Q5PPY7_9ACTO|nr:potassium-transporting ATPase subunit KdpA [Boudabousia liubingyangii]OKL49576.1 potassium-transporting ATPase subunit A [Boudabousia liubingyangii]